MLKIKANMMDMNYHKYYLFVLSLIAVSSSFGQIGIGTLQPEGALDLESSTMGLVLPRIALESTLDDTNVQNPTGNPLVIGTTVYNTAITTNGANDVYQGIYSWDGTSWKPQFPMEEYVKFEQTGGCQRTQIRECTNCDPDPTNVDNVNGLDDQIFVPTYSGIYRVEVKTNFSAGQINDFTSDDALSLATSEGAFFFSMSGLGVSINPVPGSSAYDYSQGWSYTHSYSVESDYENPAIESYTSGTNPSHSNAHFATLQYRIYLIANEIYTFNLSNNIYTGNDYFIGNGDPHNNGSILEGQGHIGHDIPCTVEFRFLGE